MAKGMNRLDIFEAFGGQCLEQVLFADPIDAVPAELLTPLTDKDAVLIDGLWGCSVFADIQLKESTCFLFKLNDPEPVSFAQDGQCVLLGIKVIQVQCCDLTGPGTRVIKQMQKGVVPESLFSFEVNGLKDLEDFLLVEKPDQGLAEALLRNVDDSFSQLTVLWGHEPDHFCKGLEGGEAQVAGSGKVVTLLLQLFEKRDDQRDRDVLNGEGSHFDAIIFCGEGQEELEGIPVGFDGIRSHPLDVCQVVVEELMN